MSSISRLAVVIDAAPYVTYPMRLPDAIARALRGLGIGIEDIHNEYREMEKAALGKTCDRSILGSMNEVQFQLESMAQMDRLNLSEPEEISLGLPDFISMALPDKFPADATLKLFGHSPRANNSASVVKPNETKRPHLYIVR